MPKIKLNIHDDPHTYLLSRIERKIKKYPDDSCFKFIKYLVQTGSMRRNGDMYEVEIKLPSYFQSVALGVTALDNGKHCDTKVTHDLSSFYCWDMEGLLKNISKKIK